MPQTVQTEKSKDEMTEEERLVASIPEELREDYESAPDVDAEDEPEVDDEPSVVDDEPEQEPEQDAEPAGEVVEEGDESDGPDTDEEDDTDAQEDPEEDAGEVSESADTEEAEEAEDQSEGGRNIPFRSGQFSIESDVYDSFISTATTFHDEGRLTISDSQVEMVAPDKSNVAMTDVRLTSRAFESIDAPDTELGIDLEKVEDSLGVFEKEDTITLSHSDETRRQTISDGTLSFDFATIALQYIQDRGEIPDFQFATEFTMSEDEFGKLINAVEMVGDVLEIESDEEQNTVKLFAHGDTDEVDKVYDSEDIDISHLADGHGMYSLNYLKPVKKAAKGADEITISFAEDYPIKITFKKHDGGLVANFLVAPKIRDDD